MFGGLFFVADSVANLFAYEGSMGRSIRKKVSTIHLNF
ncbi:hypothetical protein FM106_14145 [Brachybacterium faecium]|nr:hypothetical protein FM106_14145 [Brachybacterium faecium]